MTIHYNAAIRAGGLLLGLALWLWPGAAAAQCTLICNSMISAPLGPNCGQLITYDMILEGEDNPNLCSPNAPTDFSVTLMTSPGGPAIPSSPYVDYNYVGLVLYAKVTHLPTGNFCIGSIRAEDYMPPVLNCPSDVVVSCNDSSAPAVTGQALADDCTAVAIDFSDAVQDLNCGDPQERILRTWTATDAAGNSAACVQQIDVARASVADVVFPPSYNDAAMPSLSCPSGFTAPTFTGFPLINGEPISGAGPCGLFTQYTDQVAPQCGGSYNIVRTWLVTSDCTSDFTEHTQIIKVKDNTPPDLICPQSLTVGTNDFDDCSGSLYLPPATCFDDCSMPVSVVVQTPYGTINANGGFLGAVPQGNATATYLATDECGNTASCTISLTVNDASPPQAICNDQLNVTLNSQGVALAQASVFDEGSDDNCCLDGIAVKRAGEPDSAFGNSVTFSCLDIGAPVTVVLQATDCAGNTSTCNSAVVVEDKIDPVILCPPPATVACDAGAPLPSVTGQPLASDGCGVASVTFSDQEFFNDCNVGTILRTFVAEDNAGFTSTCVQSITVIDTTPITVLFPDDYEIDGCASLDDLHPDNLPAPFDRPQVVGEDCEITASNWSDLEFFASGNSCVKVIRTWTVIDWCTYTGVGTDGQYQENQILKIKDNDPPQFTCPDDLAAPILGSGCTTTVTLPQLTDVQDCLDEITVTVAGDLGSGFVHPDVGIGDYEVTYLVTDGCGNTASCSFTVSVFDGRAPGIVCLNGLSTSLMPDGMISVPVDALVVNAFDNCSPQSDIELRLGPDDATTPPDGDVLVFDCDNLGTNIVTVWAGDAAGNWDFCETYILVEDNEEACIPMAMISGVIHTELYEEVGNVEVMVNEDTAYLQMTAPDGMYMFPEMPMGDSYQVVPKKDINAANGVTTMDAIYLVRHLLNVEPLSSPYRIIAADVNRSGHVSVMDLIALKRVILGIADTFPDNTSWRFVDEDYVFPDPENPFYESWPEDKTITSLDDNMLGANFMGVKIGDLDLSADNDELLDTDERDQLVMRTENREAAPGSPLRLPFYFEAGTDLQGVQFTLDFDAGALVFRGVESGELSDFDASNLGLRYLDAGRITVSWFAPEALRLAADRPAFTFVFEARTSAPTADLVTLSSAITRAEGYVARPALERRPLALSLAAPAASVAASVVVRSFPNPFRRQTTLAFDLPADQALQLTVWDPAGRPVSVQRRRFAAGRGQWILRSEAWPGAGYYFYRIEGADWTANGKLLFLGP